MVTERREDGLNTFLQGGHSHSTYAPRVSPKPTLFIESGFFPIQNAYFDFVRTYYVNDPKCNFPKTHRI